MTLWTSPLHPPFTPLHPLTREHTPVLDVLTGSYELFNNEELFKSLMCRKVQEWRSRARVFCLTIGLSELLSSWRTQFLFRVSPTRCWIYLACPSLLDSLIQNNTILCLWSYIFSYGCSSILDLQGKKIFTTNEVLKFSSLTLLK